MLAGIFREKPVFSQFMIVVGVVLFCTGVFTIIGAYIAEYLYGVDMITDPDILSKTGDPAVLSALKLVQILSTGVGMFLIPSFVIAYLFSTDPVAYLGFRGRFTSIQILISGMLILVAVPVINFLLEMNQNLALPDFLSGLEDWMIRSEESAMALTEAFLVMNSPSDLFLNLFMMALLPALGEELIFRGVLQKLVKDLSGNIHVAVLVAAFVFSAFHMQFYGFLPRFLLGVLFGYLLVWSGSIWLPIVAHFVNNAAAVLFAWYAGSGSLPFDQDTVGTGEGEWKLTVVSVVLIVLLLMMLRRISGLNSSNGQEVT